jgi:23S rRNA-intervening sequence protein
MAPHITSYRDLIVWQKAMDLAELVYRMTDRFPSRERFGHRLRYVSAEEMRSFEELSASVGQLAHALVRSLDTGS